MDAYVKAVYGDIVRKFNNFLVQEGENETGVWVPQNFIYAFSDTVGGGHGSKRGKAVIGLSTREMPVSPETGYDILLDSDRSIWMHYVISDHNPDIGDGT